LAEAAIISVIIFSALGVLFYHTLLTLFNNEIENLDDVEIKLSVIIAAKNEASNISRLFTSLEKQNYPKDKFEIIFVDDNSSDTTFSEAQKFTSLFPNLRLFKADYKKLPAKKGALDLGITESRFPFLLFTDADCVLQNGWLKTFSNKFAQNYDVIFGLAPFAFKRSFANHFFCFENLRTTMLTFTAAQLGMPYSGASRSLGIVKETFLKLGGFNKTLQTVGGDDDLLIREAVKNNCKIGIVTGKNSLVFTDPEENFSEYVKQKRRHTATSFHYLAKHKLFLALWHLLNILAIDALFLIPFFPEAGFIFLSKILCDYILVYSFQKKFNYKFSFGEIFFFQILYECFIVFNFFSAKFLKIKWK